LQNVESCLHIYLPAGIPPLVLIKAGEAKVSPSGGDLEGAYTSLPVLTASCKFLTLNLGSYILCDNRFTNGEL